MYQLPSCQTSHSPSGVTLPPLAVLHRHCHGRCCPGLTDSPPLCLTKLATDSHADFVHLCNARVDECINSFVCSMDELGNGPWSSLAPFCAADPFSTGVSDHFLSWNWVLVSLDLNFFLTDSDDDGAQRRGRGVSGRLVVSFKCSVTGDQNSVAHDVMLRRLTAIVSYSSAWLLLIVTYNIYHCT